MISLKRRSKKDLRAVIRRQKKDRAHENVALVAKSKKKGSSIRDLSKVR